MTARTAAGWWRSALFVLAGALAGAPRAASGQSPSADPAARVEARRTDATIRLDGVPDEPVWLAADSVTDFRQREPREGEEASERTVVRILATERGLYFAFWCYDRDPASIRRTQLRRDPDLDADDFVAILIDAQFDRRSAYAFAVNPNGSMTDVEVLNQDDENENWDAVWDARARVTPFGWTAEILFPWQMLRYRIAGREWGLNLGRIIRRKQEEVLWRGWLRQQGFYFQQVQGTMEVPDQLPRRRPFEGRPYIAGGVQGDTRTYLPSGTDSITAPGGDSLRFGFDGKLAVGQTLTLDLTLNTDFAQVEADQQVVNLTRFPVFFPEKREFFLESSGTFDFGRPESNQLFHSRRIGLAPDGTVIPIVAGTRLTGRVGSERIGLLAVRTGGNEDALDVVGRVKHDIFSRGYVGAMGTLQGGPGVAGTRLAGGADFNVPTTVGRGQNLILGGWAMWSRDSVGAATPGSWYLLADYPNDWSDDFISIMRVDSGFDPALGFVRQDGIWRLNSAVRFSPRPHRWGIRRLFFTVFNAEVFWKTSGGLDHAQYNVQPLGAEFESGDEIEFNLYHFDDVPADSFDIAGVPVPPGSYGYDRGEVSFQFSQKRPVSGGMEVSFGEFYGGDAISVGYEASARVAPHVIAGVEGSVDWGTLPAGPFTAQVHRLRFDYASSPRLNTTLFLQWDSESDRMAVNARLHWIPRPGVDAYLVWNSAWPTGLDSGVPWRQPLRSGLIGKFVYYFRV